MLSCLDTAKQFSKVVVLIYTPISNAYLASFKIFYLVCLILVILMCVLYMTYSFEFPEQQCCRIGCPRLLSHLHIIFSEGLVQTFDYF